MSKRKTRTEKIESGYRLQNFVLKAKERAEVKDRTEFGYLANEYVVKDLTRTAIYTLVIVGLLLVAKKYLG